MNRFLIPIRTSSRKRFILRRDLSVGAFEEVGIIAPPRMCQPIQSETCLRAGKILQPQWRTYRGNRSRIARFLWIRSRPACADEQVGWRGFRVISSLVTDGATLNDPFSRLYQRKRNPGGIVNLSQLDEIYLVSNF